MKRFVGLLCLLLLFSASSIADEILALEIPDKVSGYTDNFLKMQCGIDGNLTMEIQKQGITIFKLADNIPVKAGEKTLQWDGLGAWDRPLPTGEYSLHAKLASGDRCFEVTKLFDVGKPAQSLQYAFSSADTLHLNGEMLTVIYSLANHGDVMIEICAANEPEHPMKTLKRSTEARKQGSWEWNGKINGAYVSEGNYIIYVYTPEKPEQRIEIPVIIESEKDETLLVTGRIMPESDDDIMLAATSPAVVADINPTSTLNVYRYPDSQSDILGTICGQTQCLEVVETAAVWTKITCWRQEDGTPVTGFVRTEKLKEADVNQQYTLLVDKAAQIMKVFHNGEIIGELPVSTGTAQYRKLEQETPAGSYLTGERYVVLRNDRESFDYAIKFAGNRALYFTNANVGGKSTTGGIAICAATEESQIDAYWLWTHIPPNTRLIILDDPVQRTLEQACAEAQMSADISKRKVLEQAPETDKDDVAITLTLGGDAVVGTREKWMKSTEALPALLAGKGMAYPFSGLQDYFSTDDMTLINLECVLKDDRTGEDQEKLYRFRGLPSYTEVLHAGHIEQVNIANNHHIDYGTSGRVSTVEALINAGIPYSGYGATFVWEIAGRKIGFGGCRETTWLQGKQDIEAEIAELRDLGCEVVVYSCHWGEEYRLVHNETQHAMAQAVANAGADIIVGHHPHVVQGIDVIDNVPVLYSLGNLMFGGTHELETRDGALARVTLRFDENGYLGATVTMIPILTSGAADSNDFCPLPASGEDRLRILAKIQADSSVLLQEQMYFPAD